MISRLRILPLSKLTAVSALLLAISFLSVRTDAGFLYALNDDSTGSRIYGFSVDEATGELSLLPGFPVSPGNGGINSIVSERMTIDKANKRLYVINDSSDTVSAYSIDPLTGALTALPFSPIALGTGTWNTVAVHPSGSPLIVSNGASGTGSLSYTITPTTATPAVGNPFLVGATSAFSSTFSTSGEYFYVGGNTGTVIAGFSVNTANGALATLPGSPFPAGGTSSIAYATDVAGRLFAMDNAFNIRIFTSSSGALSPVTGNPFASGMTQRRFGLVHPNGNFYIIAGNSGNNVGVYAISGSGSATTVAAVSGSPFPTGATTANTLALNHDGTLLFVGNRISRSITKFSFDPATGELSANVTQPSNTLGTVGAINGMAYLPSGPLVAEANISGRITTAEGNGVGNTVVYLESSDQSIRMSAITSPFGYFSFLSVPTGRSYTITPSRKGFAFTPTSIVRDHNEEVNNLDFVGSGGLLLEKVQK